MRASSREPSLNFSLFLGVCSSARNSASASGVICVLSGQLRGRRLVLIRTPRMAAGRARTAAKLHQRPRNEGPRRQLGLETWVLARPVSRVKDLACPINLGAQPLGPITGQRGLLQQGQPPGVPNIVLRQDGSP
jgi:hypothetical protein